MMSRRLLRPVNTVTLNPLPFVFKAPPTVTSARLQSAPSNWWRGPSLLATFRKIYSPWAFIPDSCSFVNRLLLSSKPHSSSLFLSLCDWYLPTIHVSSFSSASAHLILHIWTRDIVSMVKAFMLVVHFCLEHSRFIVITLYRYYSSTLVAYIFHGFTSNRKRLVN